MDKTNGDHEAVSGRCETMSITESSTQELTIDRIECSEFSDSDFRKHYRGKRPFILTSALSTLSPQTYDLDNLGELLGDEQFYVRIYGEQPFQSTKTELG